MVRQMILVAVAGLIINGTGSAQTKPDFCYNGATDRCQQVQNIWDLTMRNDNHKYYCTSEG